MTIVVILAHPDEGSFNHAIARTVVDRLAAVGHAVVVHDLYREGFEAVLPGGEIPREAPLPPVIAHHCEEIAAADGIVIVHPNWWGMPPAILKGWVDRVIRPGVAYAFLEGDSGEGVPVGLLKARAPPWCSTPPTRRRSGNGRCSAIRWKRCGKTAFSDCVVWIASSGGRSAWW